MLYLYLGTDREKTRAKMAADIATATKSVKGAEIVRITDANTINDLRASLQGGGMFAQKRVLVFENVCANVELCDVLVDSLEMLSKSNEKVFVFEEKPLAELRKKLEKYAESVEKFDAPKSARGGSAFGGKDSIFAIANALRRVDKKALWVSYMREIAKDAAPEAIHGVLFWAAKDMFLKAGRDAAARTRAAALIASLSELPHAARRRGEELEYALERFCLSQK